MVCTLLLILYCIGSSFDLLRNKVWLFMWGVLFPVPPWRQRDSYFCITGISVLVANYYSKYSLGCDSSISWMRRVSMRAMHLIHSLIVIVNILWIECCQSDWHFLFSCPHWTATEGIFSTGVSKPATDSLKLSRQLNAVAALLSIEGDPKGAVDNVLAWLSNFSSAFTPLNSFCHHIRIK